MMSFMPGNNPISKQRSSLRARAWQKVSDSVVVFSRKYPYKWPSVFGEIKRNSDAAFDRFDTVRPPKDTAINIAHVWMVDILPIEQVQAFSQGMLEAYTRHKSKKWFIPNNLDDIRKLPQLETEIGTQGWHNLGSLDPNPDMNKPNLPLVDWIKITVYRCFPTHVLLLIETRPSDLFRYTFKMIAGYDSPAGYTLYFPKMHNILRFWGSRHSTRVQAKYQLIEDLFLDLKWGTKKFLQQYAQLGEFSRGKTALPPAIELFHVGEVGRMPYENSKESRRNRFWDSLGMSRKLRGYSNEHNTVTFFPPEYIDSVNESPVIKILLNDARFPGVKGEPSEEFQLIDRADAWVYGFVRSFSMIVLGARLRRSAAKKWREFSCRNKGAFLWKAVSFFSVEEEISNCRFLLSRLVGAYSPQEEMMNMKTEGVPELWGNLELSGGRDRRPNFIFDFPKVAQECLRKANQDIDLVQKAGQELLQRELAKSNYFLAAMVLLATIVSIVISLSNKGG
jgi:hypothetical protein